MIYLIRHGQTVWNTRDRRQGWMDSPLTQRGFDQAKRNGARLATLIAKNAPIKFYASPLGRAWQTASVIAEEIGFDPDQITLDAGLREVRYGDWEGKTEAQIAEEFPDLWAARVADKWNTRPPGGESYADLHARVQNWYRHADITDNTIVVTHGITSKALRGVYAGLAADDIMAQDNPQDSFYALDHGSITEIMGA